MKRAITAAIFLLANQCLWAQEVQSLERLKTLALNFAKEQTKEIKSGKAKIRIGTLDSRLNLATCPEEKIRVFNPYSRPIEQTNTLGISCHAESHWKVYLPISIKIVTPVIVAKHFVGRGQVIGPDDITRVEMNIKRLRRGYFKDPKDVVGHISKYNLSRGKIIIPASLKLAKLIHRGEKVHIIAAHPSISVRMKGIALSSGSLGQRIRVRNVSSRKQIEATIVGPQKVRVNL